MEKIEIDINDIKSNPNLDLSERVEQLKRDENTNYSDDELRDLAAAIIKQEYEIYANQRTNVSDATDKLLEKIKNGGILSKKEGFMMFCDDPKTVEQYGLYEDIKDNIKTNNAITMDDFEYLCKEIGFDYNMKELIKLGFIEKGLLIEKYKDKDENKHRQH